MPEYAIVLTVIAAAIILYCAVMLAVAAYAQRTAFGRRFEKNKLLKYFSAEEFGLETVPVYTYAGRDRLGGFIYSCAEIEKCKTLIIFSHGMGPGQCAYMTEIAYFCRQGCAVLAFDCSGCTLSEGKALKGLENSTRCLAAAAAFAKADPRLKDKKMVYVGHSMGGYSALCAGRFEEVDGAVAFAAPDSPSRVLSYRAEEVTGRPLAYLIRPFLKVVAFFLLGRYANVRASRAVKKSGVKALLFQGDADPQVPLEVSAYSALKSGGAQCVLCAGKGHNPYNTFAAEKLLKELGQGLARADKMSGQEREEFFSSRDYFAICEEDASVMARAMDFINNL